MVLHNDGGGVRPLGLCSLDTAFFLGIFVLCHGSHVRSTIDSIISNQSVTYLECERGLPPALAFNETCPRVEECEELPFEHVVRVQRHRHGRRRACEGHCK